MAFPEVKVPRYIEPILRPGDCMLAFNPHVCAFAAVAFVLNRKKPLRYIRSNDNITILLGTKNHDKQTT